MAKVKSLDDAKLLVEAGESISGIKSFLTCGPTTQPADYLEDVKDAAVNIYPASTIKKYFQVLVNNNLHEKANELYDNYKKLRKKAKLKPIKLRLHP